MSTLVQYAVLVVLVEAARVDATVASSIGFVASAVLNYRLNYSLTFHSDLPHRVAAPRFVVTACVGLMLNAIAMFVLNSILSIQYLIAQILATGIALCWNFIVNHTWSFNSEGRDG